MAIAGLEAKAGIAAEEDRLGGTNYLVDSGLYKMEIDTAYLGKSTKGAMSLNLVLKNDASILRQTIYLTSGDKKGNKNTYTDKNGDDQYLPGFSTGNSIALLTIGKEIGSLTTSKKIIDLYDYDQSKNMPTEVDMLQELVGKSAIFGVLKIKENKNKLNDQNKYVPTNDVREFNEIQKVFRMKDSMTVLELTAKADKAEFIDQWDTRFSGKTKDNYTPMGGAGTAGAPVASGGTTPSLFP